MWVWKIVSDETWYSLVKAKYMQNGNVFLSKNKGVSQFWKGLHKVKHLFRWGVVFSIGDGKPLSVFGMTHGWETSP
jgi:hypothetical protein